jgi:hypothetical protein
MLTERFDAALLFASKLHRAQCRKGPKIPYLGHLLAVAALVIEDGGSEDEAIAALLHDSIEDQGQNFHGGREALRAYIREQFGAQVAALVDACTDDEGFVKGAAATPEEERTLWLRRKHEYVVSIETKTPEALRVTTADKIHNAESILDAYAKVGPEVWNRFRTKSRNDTIENYRNLSDAITKKNEGFEPDKRSGLPYRLSRAVDLLEKVPSSSNPTSVIVLKEPPSADQEWQRLTVDLALCLGDLLEDEYLIISSKRLNYYVQFADQGKFGMRVEATSNTYLDPGAGELSTDAYAAMEQLGWKFPTGVPSPSPDTDGSPNFFMDLSRPVDFASVAELAVKTFRRIYFIDHPGRLQYKSFLGTGGRPDTQIRFPTLRIKREE